MGETVSPNFLYPCTQSATVEFDRLPLIANLPPLVLDCSRLTLLDLGRRDFMYSTNLPPAAQARRRPSPVPFSL